MTKTNDEIIMELKEKISQKEEVISKMENGNNRLKTNCMITVPSIGTLNLHVIKKNELETLGVFLNMMLMSAKDLHFVDENEYEYGGYSLPDWLNDIDIKLAMLNVKEEKQKLNNMKNKLDNMLSDTKKVELELQKIMSEL